MILAYIWKQVRKVLEGDLWLECIILIQQYTQSKQMDMILHFKKKIYDFKWIFEEWNFFKLSDLS